MSDKLNREEDFKSESDNSARSQLSNEVFEPINERRSSFASKDSTNDLSNASSIGDSKDSTNDLRKEVSHLPVLTLHDTGGGSKKIDGNSDAASLNERAEWIKNPENQKPVDLKTIWSPDSRVLSIGDHHPSMSTKKWTEENMKQMAEQGATAFAMEFLPKSSQQLLDDYAKLRREGPSEDCDKMREKLLNQIISQQRGPEEAPNEKMEPPLKYQMNLVDAAIDAGMRPLAMEPNISGMWTGNAGFEFMHKGMEKLPATSQAAFDRFASPDTSDRQREEARQELESLLKDDPSFSGNASRWLDEVANARKEGLDFSSMKVPAPTADAPDNLWDARTQDMRNRTWAAAASEYLNSNPNAKLVMFSGGGHFKYGDNKVPLGEITSANEYLGVAGHKSTVLQFAGGDYAKKDNYEADRQNMNSVYWQSHLESGVVANKDGSWPDVPEESTFYEKRWTDAAHNAGVDQKDFAIQIARTSSRQADWVIHLKQDRMGRL